MALIKCKECGHRISKTAKTCSNCGRDRAMIREGSLIYWIFYGAIIVSVTALVLILIANSGQ